MSIATGSGEHTQGMVRKRVFWVAWTLITVLSVGNAVYAYRYLPRIGLLASSVMANAFVNPWLDIHVAGAATALLLGSFQFLAPVRTRWSASHRWVGRIYVTGCMVGGAGGLLLAIGSTAGPIASAGFGGLSIAWIGCNVQGWLKARSRRFADHRAWMIRGWALTLAAVTLRLYLPLAIGVGLPALASYRAISFLCWIPNLIVAELYLRAGGGRLAIQRYVS